MGTKPELCVPKARRLHVTIQGNNWKDEEPLDAGPLVPATAYDALQGRVCTCGDCGPEGMCQKSRGDNAGFTFLLSVTYHKKTKSGKSEWGVCKQRRREQREPRNVGLAECPKSPSFQTTNQERDPKMALRDNDPVRLPPESGGLSLASRIRWREGVASPPAASNAFQIVIAK